MNLRCLVSLAAGAAALLAPQATQAQLPTITPFSVELRAGVASPTGALRDDLQAGTRYAVGGSAAYHFFPGMAVYGGYSMAEFSGPGEISFTDSGFDAGLRVAIPTPLIPIDPWVRGGATYRRLTVNGAPGTDGDADWGLGFEAGAGLGFAVLGNLLSLTPGVSVVSYTPGDAGSAVRYVRLDVGARLRL